MSPHRSASAIARSASHERLGVGAGEEVQLPLDGRQLGARTVVVAALGVGLGLDRQRDATAQVAALEHDRGLEHEGTAAQRGIVERPRDLVAADRLGQRRLMVLVVEVARAVQRAVDLDRLACGHITHVLDRWSADLSIGRAAHTPTRSAPARPFWIAKVASVEADASALVTVDTIRNSLVQSSGVRWQRT